MSQAFLFPVVLVGGFVGLAAIIGLARRRADQAWASGVSSDDEDAWSPAEPQSVPSQFPTIEAAIAELRASDDAFSWVLFEDFLHALYVEAQTLRGTKGTARLDPYISEEALASLRATPADSVSTVIVGALRIDLVDIDRAARRILARATFTANYTEELEGKAQSYYVEETWHLSRDADVQSRPPERASVVDCPSCGAPLDKIVAGKCRHCGATSAAGSRDWRVDTVSLVSREPRGPMLTGTTEEVGTDLPTRVAVDVKAKLAALTTKDPAFTWLAFSNRVTTVFSRFHEAWTAQALEGVRPYLSDNLFETQRYWVDTYKAAGLRNVTESPAIAAIHLCRITSDKYFDAVTVRVYASCVDYTIDGSGDVVGGSKRAVRQYSEYWTFIRGVDRVGAPKADDGCPNCGGPIADINMAGICRHCQAKVTTGQFDWVLSRIEQDEVYEG